MLRALFLILLLAAPVVAAPGDWKATRYGPDEREAGPPGTKSGNLTDLDVRAHATRTFVDLVALVCALSADEDGTGTDMDTVWFELKCTEANPKDPTWKITTEVFGEGKADTDVSLQGSASAESVQVVKVTGDHTNAGSGELAVSDTGGGKISISIPKGLGITLAKSTHSKATDNYEVKVPKTTTGTGTACRIRIDTYAKAHGAASSKLGVAIAGIFGSLRVKIEMEGSSTVDGKKVTDSLRVLPWGYNDFTRSRTEPPDGGYEGKPYTVPTDKPTEEEKSGSSTTEEKEEGTSGGATTGTGGAATTESTKE